VVSENEPGVQLVLDRNPNWDSSHDSIRRALPGQIVVKYGNTYQDMEDAIVEDNELGKTAVMLDPVAAASTGIIFNLQRTAARRVSGEDPFISFTAFNVSKLSCLPIRQAIFYALDRQALTALTGTPEFVGDLADGLLKPSLFPDSYAKITGYEDAKPGGNPTKARELLNRAKSVCPDVYKRATVDGLTFDTTNLPIHQAGVAIWSASLAKAGIKLTGNLIPKEQYYGIVFDTKLQGDLSRAGWAPDWLSPSTVIADIAADGNFNLVRNQDDPAYKKFLVQVRDAEADTDAASRSSKWRAINQSVMDNMWVLPGVFSKTQFIWGSGVTGVSVWTPYGCVNFNDIKLTSNA
jgi:peptide/nickel transport system substrate-binding protein